MELGFAHGHSFIHRLDPRVRIVTAFAFALLVALGQRPLPLLAALCAAIMLIALARLRPRQLAWQLAAVNVFLLILWITLPLSTAGETIARIGPAALSREGVMLAFVITLKCNAIVLASTALLATMDVVRMGHALHHLKLPEKLIHVFLFTVRYFDLLHREYHKLSSAMRVRCFHPRMNRHTYRAFGHLVGMLLVRSFDRSERVLAAMKCRGFNGRLYILNHFRLHSRDLIFACLSTAALAALGVMLWL